MLLLQNIYTFMLLLQKTLMMCFYVAIGNGLDVVIDDKTSIDSGLNHQIGNVVFGRFMVDNKTDNEKSNFFDLCGEDDANSNGWQWNDLMIKWL